MFEEIRSRIPSLATWMESCYGSQPLLHLGEDTLLSCCGIQQGEPLGPLGFALTLHPKSECINEEEPDLTINDCYLDDGTLCGSPENLAKALKIIEDPSQPCGIPPLCSCWCEYLSQPLPLRQPHSSGGVLRSGGTGPAGPAIAGPIISDHLINIHF